MPPLLQQVGQKAASGNTVVENGKYNYIQTFKERRKSLFAFPSNKVIHKELFLDPKLH